MTATGTGQAVSVSVVICAYTEARWDDLVAAVRSVRRQDPSPEVIVVIDHNEALFDRVRVEILGIEVIVNTGRRGLSGARNAGMALATGDIVAFLDDDAEAEDQWLPRLVEAYRDGDVLGVGGSVTPSWTGTRPGWFPPEFDWVVGCSYHGMPETSAPVRNFIGTNMSFRRVALVASGGFDSELGRVGADANGCEETELCIRMVGQGGGRLIYEPSAASPTRFRRRGRHGGISPGGVTRRAARRPSWPAWSDRTRLLPPSGRISAASFRAACCKP